MKGHLLYQQLGKFVILFQNIERAIIELMVLMAKADDEAIEILVNELDYSKKIKTTDVLFSHYINIRTVDSNEKNKFHILMTSCLELGELRNNLLHSSYAQQIENGEVTMLIRINSKLRSSKGIREVKEDNLTNKLFNKYFEDITSVLHQIEAFRLKIIYWEYPENEKP